MTIKDRKKSVGNKTTKAIYIFQRTYIPVDSAEIATPEKLK